MILIAGATGLLGGLITRSLLDQGQRVRIVARAGSPSAELARAGMATASEELIAAGAEPVAADLKDRASLDAACAGVETVITTANAAVRGGADTFESVDLAGTRSLIDAAAAAGVRHFVYVSALGAEAGHQNPLLSAKGHSEEALRGSGMGHTILRPAVFMEVWVGAVVGIPLGAGQPVTLVDEGARRQAFVSMVDVAACAVSAALRPAEGGRTVVVSDPDTHSWREVVGAVGRAVGRDVPVRSVAPGAPIPLLPESMWQLLGVMELADTVLPQGAGSTALGVVPTPLGVYVRRTFGGGAAAERSVGTGGAA